MTTLPFLWPQLATLRELLERQQVRRGAARKRVIDRHSHTARRQRRRAVGHRLSALSLANRVEDDVVSIPPLVEILFRVIDYCHRAERTNQFKVGGAAHAS